MYTTLKNKTALITGSTQGIGFEVAKGLAQINATVIIHGRSIESVNRSVKQLSELLPEANIKGIASDISTLESCDAIITAYPNLDIIVSNAAIFETADFFGISDETWQLYWDTNLLANVRLARHYLPRMKENNWGRFVLIGSECGISTPPDMLHYATTKTAMLGLSRGLAKTMKGTGVTVNAVLPGPTLTQAVEDVFSIEREKSGKSIAELGSNFVKEIRPSSITERFQTAEEVANLVVYTCSTLSSGTTGAALRVDGGVADTPI